MYKEELLDLVSRRLIRQGEICMVKFIAENLIVEEIMKRRKINNEKHRYLNLNNFLPALDIFNSVSYRVSKLYREKGPLIYLKMKPFIS